LLVFEDFIFFEIDDRSGGPKVWIYKDRDTGEGNGRATVTYEDDETADKAIQEYNGKINFIRFVFQLFC
jgi:stress response protein SCP2